MDNDTPALEIRPNDRAANCIALGQLLRHVTGPVRFVADIRYGLGGWMQLVMERWPKAYYHGFEQDAATYDAIVDWPIPSTFTLHIDNVAFDPKYYGKKICDLLLADFNTLTVLKQQPLHEALVALNPTWVIFTDVASSKLHLNYKSYGLLSPNLKAYWNRFRVPHYKLVTFNQAHHTASTALYRRKP